MTTCMKKKFSLLTFVFTMKKVQVIQVKEMVIPCAVGLCM